MATPTPSEKLWKVAPTRYLPSQSILTCFATKSTAGWQAPRDRQLPCDVRLGSKLRSSDAFTKSPFDPRITDIDRLHRERLPLQDCAQAPSARCGEERVGAP